MKVLWIFSLPLYLYQPKRSIQFNIYQSHENVLLFLQYIRLATLKLRVEMSDPIYGTRRNWSMTRIIGLLNVDLQKTNTFIQETAFAWKMIGEAFFTAVFIVKIDTMHQRSYYYMKSRKAEIHLLCRKTGQIWLTI